MAVTTYAYLLERIYECLVDGAGTTHTLSSTYRFQRGMPPGVAPMTRKQTAIGGPAVYATVAAQQVDPFASGENNGVHLYAIKVHLLRDYYLGYQGDGTELDAQQVRALDDFGRVRAVLCAPGNMKQTEEGNGTGLASESLNGATARTELLRETSLGATERLLQLRDTFDAVIEFQPPS